MSIEGRTISVRVCVLLRLCTVHHAAVPLRSCRCPLLVSTASALQGVTFMVQRLRLRKSGTLARFVILRRAVVGLARCRRLFVILR